MNTQCNAQTTDWSRCERPATRTVDSAAISANGFGSQLCEQHAKLAERALARMAPVVQPELERQYDRSAAAECTTRLYNGTTCYRVATTVVEGRGYCKRHAPAPTGLELGDLVLTPRGEPGKVVHLYSSAGERHAFVKREIDGRSIAFALASLRPLDRPSWADEAPPVYCRRCGQGPLVDRAALVCGRCAELVTVDEGHALELDEARARRDALVVADPGTGRGSCSGCGVLIGNYHEAYCRVYRLRLEALGLGAEGLGR
jgi:hypothetical protein